MKRNMCLWLILYTICSVQLCLAEDITTPTADYFSGDSAVYNGSAVGAPPNIMFFIDSSQQMGELGSTGVYTRKTEGAYYEGSYTSDAIYYKKKDSYSLTQTNLSETGDNCSTADEALYARGFYWGCLNNDGSCCDKGDEPYYTGDYLNWHTLSESAEWTAKKEYSFDDIVYNTGDPDGVKYKCISGGTSGDGTPFPSDGVITDGTAEWEAQIPLIELVADILKEDVFLSLIEKANVGLMHYGIPQGGSVLLPAESRVDTVALNAALVDTIVPAPADQTANSQPLASALWDAGCYFDGLTSTDMKIIYTENTKNSELLLSPIEYWCQQNHVVVIATGAEKENLAETGLPDANGDGNWLPEVANYLKNDFDHVIGEHSANVHTHIIQLMTPELSVMVDAAAQGGGEYIYVSNPKDIVPALLTILTGILEADSSFVAPVVPASPDNRAYSGDKIYLGFFKPMNDEPWYGNLKKFTLSESQIKGFNSEGAVIDATDGEGFFVNDGGNPATPTVGSYWGSTMDGGEVNFGGVGGKLLLRDTPRKIYTYAGTDLNLTDLSNAFVVKSDDVSPNVSPATLGVDEASEAVKLIKYIHGYDAYGSDTSLQRDWILGDIMHSKPVVLHYGDDLLTDADETNSYIFIGSNDGMLHAFDDSNGEEKWAFIPNDLLKYLKYIPDTDHHTYFVDSSPVIYHNDVNNNGLVDDADTATLICGMRRGGGTSTIPLQVASTATNAPSMGAYFALDITEPTAPKFKWQISSEEFPRSPGFDAKELGQTWSLPRLTKIRIGDDTKVVAIFGAGYDTNEDLRYGNTQTFPDGTAADPITSDANDGADTYGADGADEPSNTSLGSSSQFSPRGRGLYVINVEDGKILWQHTFADTNDSEMKFAMPSDPLVVDRDSDGYADHIYIGDTGGQLWRFNIADVDTDKWEVTRIFKANVDSDDDGRKLFYKPTATINGDDTFIYFGTGDREHPLNTAVIDRFYVVRDRENDPPTFPLTEANLVDVTLDELQNPALSAADKSLLRDKLGGDYTVTDGVSDTTYYGWYIKLDAREGEKVLAVPKVFNNMLFFTTFTQANNDPSVDGYDPCEGVLGQARLYAVNAKTGEAIFNFDNSNDGGTSDEPVIVLKRSDRTLNVGKGISSEALIIVDNTGAISIMVGRGGGFFNSGAIGSVDPVFPVYWMKW